MQPFDLHMISPHDKPTCKPNISHYHFKGEALCNFTSSKDL